MNFLESIPLRIRAKILVKGLNECWPWTGSTQWSGHGDVHWQGKTERVHRVIYMLTKGEIPPGMEVTHACNRPYCVNPSHLMLGTHAQNQAHMGRSGRAGTKKIGKYGLQGVSSRRGDVYVARATEEGSRFVLYQGPDFFEACCARKSWEAKRAAAIHGDLNSLQRMSERSI